MIQDIQPGQLWRLIDGESNKALNPMQFEKDEYYLVIGLGELNVLKLMTTRGEILWIYQTNLLRYLYRVS